MNTYFMLTGLINAFNPYSLLNIPSVTIDCISDGTFARADVIRLCVCEVMYARADVIRLCVK